MEKDSNRVHELFDGVKTGKGFDLSDVLDAVNSRYGFAAGKSTHQDRLNTIKSVYENYNDLIDPHTADGVKVARELQKEGEVIVCAETALPVKFSETIFEAVGEIDIERPEHTKDIESLEQHVTVLDNDASLVADEIRAVVSPV